MNLTRSTRVKTVSLLIVAALAVVTLGLAPTVMSATGLTQSISASAHDKSASLTCAKASVKLTNYDKNATAKVTLDDVVLFDGKIPGSGYILNQALDPKVNHSLTVTVRSNDGSRYNLDFSETTKDCAPPPGPPTQTVDCDVITANYNRPLTNGDHINATITPPGSQVNMYVDQNITGGASYNGQNNLGLRWKILGVEQTPIPLTLSQIKSGIITLPYGSQLTQASWTVSFIQTNETDTWPDFKCSTVIEVSTVPAATAVDSCGTTNDKLTVPADSNELAYTVNDTRVNGVGSVTVTADAKAGFVLKEDAVRSWTFTFTDTPCPVVITAFAAATAVDKCGVTNDTLSVPEDTNQVSYAVNDGRVAGVGSVTVKASAKTGFVFGKDAVTSWTFTFTDTPCPVKDAVASVSIDKAATCTTVESIKVNTKNAAAATTIIQTVGTHTATFIAQTGHQFSDGTSQATVTYTVKDKKAGMACAAGGISTGAEGSYPNASANVFSPMSGLIAIGSVMVLGLLAFALVLRRRKLTS